MGFFNDRTFSFSLPKAKMPPSKADKLLEKKPLIDYFLSRYPSALSVFSFANIFLWQDFFDFRFEVLEERLCVWAHSDLGCFLYLPPLGGRCSPQLRDQVFARMQKENRGRGVGRIENVEAADLADFPQPQYQRFHKSDEYLYERAKIAQLAGQALKSRRHDLHFFERHYSARFLPYTEEKKDACLNLYAVWAEERAAASADEVYWQMIEENRRVHALALDYAAALNLIGRVVEIDGNVRAYTFGYPLSSDTFAVLFEIADRAFNGLATFVFSRFCADEELLGYSWINAMDDFGLEKVRFAKKSFHPERLIPAYVVSLPGQGSAKICEEGV